MNRAHRLTLILIALLLLTHTKSAGADDHKVSWLGYTQALQKAERSDRPVFLYFYSDRCPYCRKMDALTLRAKQVVDYLQDSFVAVRIDADAESHLVRKYMVRGFPTSWFLAPDGRAISYLPGYLPPEDFAKVLHYIGDGYYKNRSLQEYLQSS
jgi:thioredoxin-related protein